MSIRTNYSAQRLFPDVFEKINLSLPLFFLIAAILEVFFFKESVSAHREGIMLIAKIFFLNHLHIFFTISMLVFFPEVRSWIKEISTEKPTNAWTIWIFVGIFFWAVEQRLIGYLGQNHLQLAAKIVGFLLLSYGIHHVVSQTLGISLMYNRNHQVKETKTEQTHLYKLNFFEKWERRLFFISLTFIIVGEGLREFSSWIPEIIDYRYLIAFSVVPFVVNLYMVKNLFAETQSNKFYFLLRTLLFPMSAFSKIALAGYLSCHGIEYLFMFIKMISNSQISIDRQRLFQFYFSASGVFLVGLIVAIFRFDLLSKIAFSVTPTVLHPFLWAAVSFSIVLSQMHYFWDREIFRMRNPITRKHIGPLLR